MTYCVGLLVREGLVMMSDTRTNAGIDNIASFRKLHVFEEPGKRVLTLASSGNLSITQSVLSLLNEGFTHPDTGETLMLSKCETMFQAAQLVGRAVREVYKIDGPTLEQQGGRFEVSFLLGGQMKERRLRLYMIYAAGNFIEATSDTPFLQIGETKYGKPILDRVIVHDLSLSLAVKVAFLSFDATMRSNLSVGLPMDIATYREGACKVDKHMVVTETDEFHANLRRMYNQGIMELFNSLPNPPWLG